MMHLIGAISPLQARMVRFVRYSDRKRKEEKQPAAAIVMCCQFGCRMPDASECTLRQLVITH